MRKLKKVKASPWNMLSTGEKVLKVIMILVKLALIAAILVAGISLVFAIGFAWLICAALGNDPDANTVYVRRI
ncbi:MAG: hypothetical protein HDT27_02605 [Subdoligranulum sp.]|nr:hypothetical protein [Subdoligranulum sp.]